MPTVSCRSCGRLLDVGDAFAGRQALCPVCLGPVPVPAFPPVARRRRWLWWAIVAVAAGAWWVYSRG